MWFKQLACFRLGPDFPKDSHALTDAISRRTFTPCLPSLEKSTGWVTPREEEGADLVEVIPNYWMLCLQTEEKVLPQAVIQKELKTFVQKREEEQQRKISAKEKSDLKSLVIQSLLPQAFTKITRTYGYIDLQRQHLILGTLNTKGTESFMTVLKQCTKNDIKGFGVNSVSPTMTQWLTTHASRCPFEIEKACVLQDPNQRNRVVRCQEQDLLTNSIQSLVKEGYAVKQLALSWQQRVNFTLSDDLTIKSIRLKDDFSATLKAQDEDESHRFVTDFMLMTDTYTKLLDTLLPEFEG